MGKDIAISSIVIGSADTGWTVSEGKIMRFVSRAIFGALWSPAELMMQAYVILDVPPMPGLDKSRFRRTRAGVRDLKSARPFILTPGPGYTVVALPNQDKKRTMPTDRKNMAESTAGPQLFH